ncbi:ABC transporter permease [Deinococcus sp. SM5_A1]|uniref:ABC transporter permease n=1 Tax=Deinococcus sp. SM5_A1 TaxID=3379094 RepID=UPI003858E26E
MATKSNLFAYLMALVSILLVWQVASSFMPGFLFPSPAQVLPRLPAAAAQQSFLEAVAVSLLQLLSGFAIAVVLVGVLVWPTLSSVPFRRYVGAFTGILQAIPPVALIPLLVLLLGFGGGPVLAVVAVAAFFPLSLSMIGAVDHLNRLHLDAVRVLGASQRQVLRRVVVPEMLPVLLSGAQAGFGNAWRSLIAAQMVLGVSEGLGGSIQRASQVGDMTTVLLNVTIIAVLAAGINAWLFEGLKRRYLSWRTA